jgi:hypothetical protein
MGKALNLLPHGGRKSDLGEIAVRQACNDGEGKNLEPWKRDRRAHGGAQYR